MFDRLVPLFAGALALGSAGLAYSQGCSTSPEIFIGNTAFNTAGATEAFDMTGICDPGPFGGDIIHHTIWFRWIATTTDTYSISTCNQANFDTKLAVLQSGCAPANTIACLDDTTGCATFTTTLEFPAVQGNTYYFAVGGYSATTLSGSGTLTLGLAGGGGGECVFECIGTDEGEACGDDNNGGCNLPFPLFGSISCGETVCGTAWASGGTRDTDWYILTLASQTEVTITIASQLSMVTGVVNSTDCATATAIDPFVVSGFCGSGEVIVCLPAGDHWIFAGPELFDGFACDSGNNQYALTVTCGGKCEIVEICPGDGDCCVANGTPGCNDAECCNLICAADPFCCDTSWDGICAAAAAGQCAVCALEPCDVPCKGTDEGEACGDDNNGGCNLPFPLFGSISCGETVCGTAWASGGTRDTDWYILTLDFQKEVTITLSGGTPMITGPVDSIDCATASAIDPFVITEYCSTASLTVCLPAGDNWIFVAASAFDGAPCGSGLESYSLTVTCGAECKIPTAKNDECETAITITNGDTAFDTSLATTSALPLDPSCEEGFGLAFVSDLWYLYEATCDGTVTISTCNQASFDTRLAAYSDCNGSIIACNDDAAGCGLSSEMQFAVTTGQLIYIRLGGYATTGTGTLTISCNDGGGGKCTSNDTCACATVITLGNTAFSSVGANSDPPTTSPAFCGSFANGFFRDIWYEFTPATDGFLTVSTCNQANYDTRLELWIGCPSEGGVLVACNDDGVGCASFTSIMEAQISCDTYLVRVGSYGAGTTGTGTVTMTLVGATEKCSPACTKGPDLNGDGCVNGADIAIILGFWDPTGAIGNGFGEADADCDGVVGGADIAVVLGFWLTGPNCP